MGNREAIQPRNIYRTEAEVILDTAGSKNQPIKRGWGDSVGVNRAWRAYKVILAYLGGLLFSEKTVVVLQDFVNQGIYKFWKYVKHGYYKVLNKRHQKRSMKYRDYLRIWNFYITEPHLMKDIWNWSPKLV